MDLVCRRDNVDEFSHFAALLQQFYTHIRTYTKNESNTSLHLSILAKVQGIGGRSMMMKGN
jgi:hypothetical protein